ncbi:MAG: gliding motility-associated C-terminal domain-containing protein [Bacteroidia bacterium]|nr:gliding motility-associated C-terminal domain-containing protein [Bacteroidia bacterium]
MHCFKSRFFLITCLVLFLPCYSMAQGNDDPCNAFSLTMTNPASCPTWDIDTNIFQGNNFGASADPLKPGYFGCVSGNDAPPVTADVWYKFIATAERLSVGVSGLGQNGVQLYLRQTSCNALIPINCDFVTAGSAFLSCDVMVPGESYYLRVFGGSSTDQATFTMKFHWMHPCDDCVQNSRLFVNPPPVQGHFFPGDTVEFTYVIKGYKPFGGDQLHGIVPDLGPGWDLSSLTPVNTPPTQPASGLGSWGWYNNIPDENSNLLNGFFYDGPPSINNNPTDNKGDVSNPGSTWTFRWKVRTLPGCTSPDDLSMNIYHLSDFETGSGTQPDCKYDADYHFKAILNCCTASVITTVNSGCKNDTNGMANLSVIAQSPPYSCQIYNASGTLVFNVIGQASPNFIISGLAAGEYTALSWGAQCTTGTAFRLKSQMAWQPQQTSFHCTPSCNNSAVITGPVVSGYGFLWSPSGQTTPTASGLCPGVYTIAVSYTNLGCNDTFMLNVTAPPPDDPAFYYEPPYGPNYCTVDTGIVEVEYLAHPGGIFSWTGPASNLNPATGDIISFPPFNGGTYTITYTTPGPCTTSSSQQLTFTQSPPAPAMSGATSICVDQQPLVITPTNMPFGCALIWDASGNFSFPNTTNPIVLTGLFPGTDTVYTIYYDALTSCFGLPSAFAYTVFPQPVANAGTDTTVCKDFTFTLSGSGGISYIWSPASGLENPYMQFTNGNTSSTTTYQLLVTDANGCRDTDYVSVYINPDDTCQLQVWNGFSPNNDGFNDTWFIEGIDNQPGNKVSVFNRWGDLVWSTGDYHNRNNAWDGRCTLTGDELPAATYFYVIQIPTKPTRSGWIELTK